jgi:hypothetical protein
MRSPTTREYALPWKCVRGHAMVAVGRATGPLTGGTTNQVCETCGNMRTVPIATAGNHSHAFKTFTARDWRNLLAGKVPFNLKDSQLAELVGHAVASGKVYGAGLAALQAEQEQRQRARPYELREVHPSLAEIPESDLIDMLITSPITRDSFLGMKGVPDQPLYRTNIPHREVPGGDQGDVDLLLWNPDRPHEATAVEAKRIKTKASTFMTGTPNKLHEIEKACTQANKLEALGFAHVFLFVYIVVDSRALLEGRKISYDGPTPEIQAKIDAAMSQHTRHLRPRVGIVEHTFIQSMDKPPDFGSGGGHFRRPATPVSQPPALTAWIGGLGGNAV